MFRLLTKSFESVAYPLLTLSDISLSFASKILFEGVKVTINKGDRIGLVGRNGSGKSSLLKILSGDLIPDRGERFLRPGVRTAYLNQNYNISNYKSIEEYIFDGVSKNDFYRNDKDLSGIEVNFKLDPANCSGGELRRAAILKALTIDSEILLLDEPTNHLDISAIEFIENYLSKSPKAIVMISHDRRFLKKLSNQMLWLDRGTARALPKGFGFFEDWRDQVFAQEANEFKKLNRKIKEEAMWAVEGISARRRRNQRRLKELNLLRNERQKLVKASPTPNFNFVSGQRSGNVVIEAKDISKTFNGELLVKKFSITICKGDRIAVVGPNGVGKTTLINLLLKKVVPDSGIVKLGSSLNISIFEQNRDSFPSGITIIDFSPNCFAE